MSNILEKFKFKKKTLQEKFPNPNTDTEIPEYLEEIELLKILFKYRKEKIAFWGASIFLERFLK